MFRVLSNEESQHVKKWRAPSLEDSDELSDQNESSSGLLPNIEEVATTDIGNLRNVVQDAHAHVDTKAKASNDDYTADRRQPKDSSGSHASLAMTSPTADMLQQSYDEGYSAGALSSKSETDEITASKLVDLLSNLTAQNYQINADIELEVVSLAKAIAKLLLRREVETDDTIILDIVRSALAQLPMTTTPPSVALHPKDLSIVENMQTTTPIVKLIPDTDMMRGDCRIESGESLLDAGVDALVDSISCRHANESRDHADTNQGTSIDSDNVAGKA